jgi:hypothetical protein
MNFCPFPQFLPICANYNITALMLLVICEFRKNRGTEDHVLLAGVNKMTFTCLP